MGGRTGHRPDLAQMTHAGRAPAVAAPPPIAPAPARRRRDPVVITALVLAVVVALGCGGFVTWRLWPASSTTTAAVGTAGAAPVVSGAPLPAAPAVSGAPEPGFSGQTGRLPSAPSSVAPTASSAAEPAPGQPPSTGGFDSGTLQPKITITLDCTQTTPTTCQGGSYSVGFRSQVTNQANQPLSDGCFDYSSVRGPVSYDRSFVCNSQGTIDPGGSSKLPDGDYTITERAEVQGGGTTSTTFRFSVRS